LEGYVEDLNTKKTWDAFNTVCDNIYSHGTCYSDSSTWPSACILAHVWKSFHQGVDLIDELKVSEIFGSFEQANSYLI